MTLKAPVGLLASRYQISELVSLPSSRKRNFSSLDLAISNQNASGEYYLTDVFSILRENGKRITVVGAVPPEDVLSINTQEQLAEVSSIMESRLAALEETQS